MSLFSLSQRDFVEQLRQCVDQDKGEVVKGRLSVTQVNLHILPDEELQLCVAQEF